MGRIRRQRSSSSTTTPFVRYADNIKATDPRLQCKVSLSADTNVLANWFAACLLKDLRSRISESSSIGMARALAAADPADPDVQLLASCFYDWPTTDSKGGPLTTDEKQKLIELITKMEGSIKNVFPSAFNEYVYSDMAPSSSSSSSLSTGLFAKSSPLTKEIQASLAQAADLVFKDIASLYDTFGKTVNHDVGSQFRTLTTLVKVVQQTPIGFLYRRLQSSAQARQVIEQLTHAQSTTTASKDALFDMENFVKIMAMSTTKTTESEKERADYLQKHASTVLAFCTNEQNLGKLWRVGEEVDNAQPVALETSSISFMVRIRPLLSQCHPRFSYKVRNFQTTQDTGSGMQMVGVTYNEQMVPWKLLKSWSHSRSTTSTDLVFPEPPHEGYVEVKKDEQSLTYILTRHGDASSESVTCRLTVPDVFELATYNLVTIDHSLKSTKTITYLKKALLTPDVHVEYGPFHTVDISGNNNDTLGQAIRLRFPTPTTKSPIPFDVVVAYGATGAGKTSTLLGRFDSTSSSSMTQKWIPGVVETLLNTQSQYRLVVWEMTCDGNVTPMQFFDNSTIEVALICQNGRWVTVGGPKSIPLSDLIAEIARRRATKGTLFNPDSSRSHCFLEMYECESDDINTVKRVLMIADFAGNEFPFQCLPEEENESKEVNEFKKEEYDASDAARFQRMYGTVNELQNLPQLTFYSVKTLNQKKFTFNIFEKPTRQVELIDKEQGEVIRSVSSRFVTNNAHNRAKTFGTVDWCVVRTQPTSTLTAIEQVIQDCRRIGSFFDKWSSRLIRDRDSRLIRDILLNGRSVDNNWKWLEAAYKIYDEIFPTNSPLQFVCIPKQIFDAVNELTNQYLNGYSNSNSRHSYFFKVAPSQKEMNIAGAAPILILLLVLFQQLSEDTTQGTHKAVDCFTDSRKARENWGKWNVFNTLDLFSRQSDQHYWNSFCLNRTRESEFINSSLSDFRAFLGEWQKVASSNASIPPVSSECALIQTDLESIDSVFEQDRSGSAGEAETIYQRKHGHEGDHRVATFLHARMTQNFQAGRTNPQVIRLDTRMPLNLPVVATAFHERARVVIINVVNFDVDSPQLDTLDTPYMDSNMLRMAWNHLTWTADSKDPNSERCKALVQHFLSSSLMEHMMQKSAHVATSVQRLRDEVKRATNVPQARQIILGILDLVENYINPTTPMGTMQFIQDMVLFNRKPPLCAMTHLMRPDSMSLWWTSMLRKYGGSHTPLNTSIRETLRKRLGGHIRMENEKRVALRDLHKMSLLVGRQQSDPEMIQLYMNLWVAQLKDFWMKHHSEKSGDNANAVIRQSLTFQQPSSGHASLTFDPSPDASS